MDNQAYKRRKNAKRKGNREKWQSESGKLVNRQKKVKNLDSLAEKIEQHAKQKSSRKTHTLQLKLNKQQTKNIYTATKKKRITNIKKIKFKLNVFRVFIRAKRIGKFN